MKSMLTKTLSATLLLAATVPAMASTVSERFIEIDNKTYKLSEVRQDSYAFYADKVKANLNAMKNATDFTQFQALLSETQSLAQNAKARVSDSFIERYDARDNQYERSMVHSKAYRLNKLLDSLNHSAQQDNLAAAKQSVLFKAAKAI